MENEEYDERFDLARIAFTEAYEAGETMPLETLAAMCPERTGDLVDFALEYMAMSAAERREAEAYRGAAAPPSPED